MLGSMLHICGGGTPGSMQCLPQIAMAISAMAKIASVLALLVVSADALQLRSRATVVKGGLATRAPRPRPEVFTLGVAASIPGFDEAVMDMQAGEKRIVIVPPNLAYGKQGTEAVGGVIPPDATLIYTLELRDLAPLEPLTAEQKTWMAANPLPWAEAAAPAPAPAPSAPSAE
ncbi:peptidyl-prolyl cis-trans isomerase [Aureococcus anophagefferens]|nr:peptidyl-prolyl cis-trans isomerase [Aureococcus anophagefferens]